MGFRSPTIVDRTLRLRACQYVRFRSCLPRLNALGNFLKRFDRPTADWPGQNCIVSRHFHVRISGGGGERRHAAALPMHEDLEPSVSECGVGASRGTRAPCSICLHSCQRRSSLSPCQRFAGNLNELPSDTGIKLGTVDDASRRPRLLWVPTKPHMKRHGVARGAPHRPLGRLRFESSPGTDAKIR